MDVLENEVKTLLAEAGRCLHAGVHDTGKEELSLDQASPLSERSLADATEALVVGLLSRLKGRMIALFYRERDKTEEASL